LRRKRVTEACNYRSRADGQSARGLLAGSNLALRLIIRAKCRCATRARALIELIKWRTVAPGLVRSRNNAPRSAEDLSLSFSLSLSRCLSGLTHLERSALTKFRPKFRAISTRHARPDSNSRRGVPLTARRADRAGHWLQCSRCKSLPAEVGSTPTRFAHFVIFRSPFLSVDASTAAAAAAEFDAGLDVTAR